MGLLTDLEMAKAQGDKGACLAIINGFGSCDGCSANCRATSKAQYQKDIKEFIEWIEEHRQIDFQGDLWRYTIKPCELDELKKSLE